MSLHVRSRLPYWRKLRLENKILVVFVCLILLVGAIGLSTQYLVTRHAARQMVFDRLAAVLDSSVGSLAEAVAEGNRTRVEILVRQASKLDDRLAYLIVSDTEGRLLTFEEAAKPASPLPVETGSNLPGNGRYIEVDFELVQYGHVVGTLSAGVLRKRVDRPALELLATMVAVVAVPVILALLLARAAVRKGADRLRQLTRVAEEISIGNLNPRIDLGVHVNCWEIKNCQRTDCTAYMSLTRQCWYVDDTPCEGYEPSFPEKLQGCRKCEVYQLHRGDEIVQLADALRHMTYVLKDSRKELVQSDDFQKRLIRNSFDGIVATDTDGVIAIFNRVAEELIGVSRESVIGSRNWRAFFEDELEKCMDLPLSFEPIRRVRGFPPRESKIKREDGKLVDVLLSGINLFEGGTHLGQVFFFQDLREVKKLREDLIRSERLAATGQAAAGISHSVKNILDGFVGGAFVFKQGKRDKNEKKMDVGWDMIERNMEIISSLVKDLLNLSKQRRPDYRKVTPARLIEDVLQQIGHKREDRISVRVRVDRPNRRIMLDAHSFQQCLTNLIRNAIDAIPPDRPGAVTVETRVAAGKAVFKVSDNGIGMSQETLEKVKGGMYSTKGSKGTGLGLLVIQKIVREHKGTLTIESEEGKGSTFRIEIPAGGVPAAA